MADESRVTAHADLHAGLRRRSPACLARARPATDIEALEPATKRAGRAYQGEEVIRAQGQHDSVRVGGDGRRARGPVEQPKLTEHVVRPECAKDLGRRTGSRRLADAER